MAEQSKYFDHLIKQWRAKCKETFDSKENYIKYNIEELKRSWDRKKLIDKIILPLLCLFFFINIFIVKAASEMLVGTFPFIAVLVLSYLQIRANNRVSNIDIGLGVCEYRSKWLQILTGELGFLKMARFVYYPLFALYYLRNIFFIYDYSSLEGPILLFLTLIGMGIMLAIIEMGIGDIKAQVKNLE